MQVITGLGNPGDKYTNTRHNVGFRVVNELATKLEISSWSTEKKFAAQIAKGTVGDTAVALLKPQSFMNNSGEAVQGFTHYYNVPPRQLVVVHDDIDLPLGTAKIQFNRGAAGHKGVSSIIEKLGRNDFLRVRIGIQPTSEKAINTERFVLEKFTPSEEKEIEVIVTKVVEYLHTLLKDKGPFQPITISAHP